MLQTNKSVVFQLPCVQVTVLAGLYNMIRYEGYEGTQPGSDKRLMPDPVGKAVSETTNR
jgi:hypothetical protein